MRLDLVIGLLLVFVASVFATWLVRRSALLHGILDVPNARSSHTLPVPRGGGLAIVFAAILGWTWLRFDGGLGSSEYLALLVGGLAIAAIGYLDDLRNVSSKIRLCIHFAIAAWAIYCLGAFSIVVTGIDVVDLWLSRLLSAFAIVWTLNLFNFMDGIDGLAGAEAVFVCSAGALMAIVAGVAGAPEALVLAAASAGFLVWNWPPARIFMGDVGSGFLGFSVAALALAAAHRAPSGLPAWMILGGVFLVDATLTLMRRVLRRERFDEAHRTHAYQIQARRWRSHRAVTVGVAVLNALFLLPAALLSTIRPDYAYWLCATVLTILVILGFIAGSGRRGE